MDEETKYADMVEIPVDTCTVTVKKSAKRGRKKASAEKLKQKVIDKVNESETSGVEAESFNAATEVLPELKVSDIKITEESENNPDAGANSAIQDELTVAETTESEQETDGLAELKKAIEEAAEPEKPKTKKESFIKRLFGKKRKIQKSDKDLPVDIAAERTAEPAAESAGNTVSEDSLSQTMERNKEETGQSAEYEPTVNITEKETKPKKFRWRTVAEVSAASVLIVSVITASVFGGKLGINKLFSKVFGKTPSEPVPYTEYLATLPCMSGSVSLENGVISIVKKGSVYPSLDGKVTSVTSENGKYSIEVEYAENLKSVYTGLDHAYNSVGDKVYRKVPLGYSIGEKYTLCFYSGEELIKDYEVDSDKIVWKPADGGEIRK